MRFAFLTIAVFVTVFVGAIYIKSKGFLSKYEIMPNNNNLIANEKTLPNKGKAPELIGLGEWINLPALPTGQAGDRQGSEPLTLANLRGKVVLIDFWTYSCINCIRSLPHVSSWYEKYKDNGFVVVGVHSPEFDFEKKLENVAREVKKYNLRYPIVQDNNHATWNAFNNRYWPAHYLIDAEGNIRYTHFGEGKYAETESAIQQLLLEANLLTVEKIAKVVEPDPDVDFKKIGTPEIYLGYLRINNIGNAGSDVKPGVPHLFKDPENIKDNRFYLSGNWKIDKEFSELIGERGKITIRYKASKLNMVLNARKETPVPIEIKLDGEYLSNQNKGEDVFFEKGKSVIAVDSARLYNLVDTRGDYGWHVLEITITKPGIKAFAFTFG